MRQIEVAFTGSRKGLSIRQKFSTNMILDCFFHNYDEITFYHGDCVGSDADFHDNILSLCFLYNNYMNINEKRIKVVLFPALTAEENRAHCVNDKRVFRFLTVVEKNPKKPLDRNKDIIFIPKFLIACPNKSETLRSGTWATVRKARELGKSVIVFEF